MSFSIKCTRNSCQLSEQHDITSHIMIVITVTSPLCNLWFPNLSICHIQLFCKRIIFGAENYGFIPRIHACPTCAPAWLAVPPTPTCTGKAVALLCKAVPGMCSLLSNTQSNGMLLTVYQLKPRPEESSAMPCWFKWWQIIVYILEHWLNRGLW